MKDKKNTMYIFKINEEWVTSDWPVMKTLERTPVGFPCPQEHEITAVKIQEHRPVAEMTEVDAQGKTRVSIFIYPYAVSWEVDGMIADHMNIEQLRIYAHKILSEAIGAATGCKE